MFFGTVIKRKTKHIYVSNWFFGAYILTIAILHIVNNIEMPASLFKSYSGLRYVYESIEMPAMRVLGIMERNGIRIDSALLAKQGQQVGKRLLELEDEIHKLAGQPFNIQSPKQIAEILFGQLELPVIKKTPSGAPSTDEEVLQKLAEDYPLPARILDYRGLAKLMSTYIEKLPRMADPKTGRVHTNFSHAAMLAARMSSTDSRTEVPAEITSSTMTTLLYKRWQYRP